jgi:hypothetical protein
VSGIDRRIAVIAGRQHGVVSARQLRVAGVSRTAVADRVADGRLRPLHRCVYAIGPLTQRGRWLAAVLALGPHAVLSHRDAAVLHGLRRGERRAIDVTAPRRARRRRGITVHETRPLHPADHTRVEGIPVTSVPRTLLDLAERLPPTQLRRAYEEAERLRLLDVRAIQALLERSNGRRGVPALRALIGYDPSAAVEAESELELRFLDLVRQARLPPPRMNVLVEGYLVDAYWPSARLVVELQGYGRSPGARSRRRGHGWRRRSRPCSLVVAERRPLGSRAPCQN